jgi:heme A synthase
LYIKNSNFFKNFQIGHLKNLAMLVLFVLVIQIFLGAWTSTNYASLACPDFPTCQGSFIPDMDFSAGFNLAQEVGPLVTRVIKKQINYARDNSVRDSLEYHAMWNASLISHKDTETALTAFMNKSEGEFDDLEELKSFWEKEGLI